MSWTDYSILIRIRVDIHDDAECIPDQLVGEATRRLSSLVEAEVALMQETAPPGVEIEVI